MSLLRQAAYAKINLHLHVTGRREDGYHLLDSLVVFAAASDRMSAEPAEDLTLRITGRFGAPLSASDPDDNLVLRAAKALARTHRIGRGASLTLEKNLPLASGIGGGSADAAAALRLLRQAWSIEAPVSAELAVGLGADVPVCLVSEPAVMRGIGDELHAAPFMPPMHMLLVNPLVPVATASVFRAARAGFSPAASLPAGWRTALDAAHDLAELRNDLQAPAMEVAPVIGEVLAAIERQDGCLLARMSGSGATCFGLFEPGERAERARRAMPARWWSWHGGMRPVGPG